MAGLDGAQISGLFAPTRRTEIQAAKRRAELQALADGLGVEVDALTAAMAVVEADVDDLDARLDDLPVFVQSGIQSAAGGASNGLRDFVIFPVAFGATPIVTATLHLSSTGYLFVKINNVSATQVRFRTGSDSGAFNDACDIHWVAIGVRP